MVLKEGHRSEGAKTLLVAILQGAMEVFTHLRKGARRKGCPISSNEKKPGWASPVADEPARREGLSRGAVVLFDGSRFSVPRAPGIPEGVRVFLGEPVHEI